MKGLSFSIFNSEVICLLGEDFRLFLSLFRRYFVPFCLFIGDLLVVYLFFYGLS